MRLLTNIGLRDSIQHSDDQLLNDDGSTPLKFLTQIEINHALTVLYVLVEAARWQDNQDENPKIGQAFGTTFIPVSCKVLTTLFSRYRRI